MIKRPHHLITRFAGHALGDSVRIRWLDLRYEVGSEQRGGWTESGERASTDFPEGTAWQEFSCATFPMLPGSGGGSEERAISGAGIRIEGARKFYLDCDALQRAIDSLTSSRAREFAQAKLQGRLQAQAAVWQATLEAMLVIARRVANSPANTALRAARDSARAALNNAIAAQAAAQAAADQAAAAPDYNPFEPSDAVRAAFAAREAANSAREAAQADFDRAQADAAQAAAAQAAAAQAAAAQAAADQAAADQAAAQAAADQAAAAAAFATQAATAAINAVEFGVDVSTTAELNANADVIEVRRLNTRLTSELTEYQRIAREGLPQVVDWRYGIMHSELEHDSVIYNAHAVNEYGHYCEVIATRRAE